MMKELTKDIHPSQMLIIYRAPKDSDVYIEQCKLIQGENGYTPGPMQPLTMEHLGNLANALRKKMNKVIIGGHVPANLHYFGLNNGDPTMLWANPARKQKLFFSTHSSFGSEAEVIMPGMIYYLEDGQLSIWCVKDQVIKPTTKLYRLPLPNTYEDGSICWGNTKKPANSSATIVGEITAWEDRFWNSEFTFHGGEELRKEWEKIIKEQRYPLSKLQPSSIKTFKSVIEGIPPFQL